MKKSVWIWMTVCCVLLALSGLAPLLAQEAAPPAEKKAPEKPLKPVVLPKIVAKVSGEEISDADLIVYVSQQQICLEYLNWLIYEKLVSQELKLYKLSVTQQEVEKDLKTVREQAAAEGKVSLEEQLVQTRMTIDDLRRVLATNIGVTKLVKREYGVKFDPNVETDKVEQWMVNLKHRAKIVYPDQSSKLDKNIVVVVNGEPVTTEDFMKTICNKLEEQQFAEFLQELLNKRLVRQFAAENKIRLEPKDIEYFLKIYEEGIHLRDPRLRKIDFAEFLQHNFNETVEQFKQRESFLLEALVFKVLSSRVNDETTRRYYEQNLDTYSDEEVRASLILIAGHDPVQNKPTKESKAAALKKAQELKQQLDKGADFAELARKNSDDKQSALNGGDLGYFRRRGRIPSDIAKQAFLLNIGEVSQPIPFAQNPDESISQEGLKEGESANVWGYFLVKKTELKKATPVEGLLLDTVRCDLIRAKLFAPWISDLREKSKIELFLKAPEPPKEVPAPAPAEKP